MKDINLQRVADIAYLKAQECFCGGLIDPNYNRIKVFAANLTDAAEALQSCIIIASIPGFADEEEELERWISFYHFCLKSLSLLDYNIRNNLDTKIAEELEMGYYRRIWECLQEAKERLNLLESFEHPSKAKKMGEEIFNGLDKNELDTNNSL